MTRPDSLAVIAIEARNAYLEQHPGAAVPAMRAAIDAALEAGAGGVVVPPFADDDGGILPPYSRGHDNGWNDAIKEVLRLNAAAPKASEAVEPWVLESARGLAVAMHRDHYAVDAPQWEPCSDLPGILSQIDNMVTGLTRTPQADPAPPVAAEVDPRAISALTNRLLVLGRCVVDERLSACAGDCHLLCTNGGEMKSVGSARAAWRAVRQFWIFLSERQFSFKRHAQRRGR